jgi:hypothetical protein
VGDGGGAPNDVGPPEGDHPTDAPVAPPPEGDGARADTGPSAGADAEAGLGADAEAGRGADADAGPDAPADAVDAFSGTDGDGGGGPPADADADATPDAEAGVVAAGDGGIQFVQVNAADFGIGLSGSLAFNAPVAAHDAIIVAVGYDVLSPVSITDSFGTAYQQAVNVTQSATQTGAAPNETSIWYAFDVPGGPDTVNFSIQGYPTSYFEVYIHEYAGLGGFDVGATQAARTPMTNPVASGFAATTAAGDLVFGYGLDGTVTTGPGFTARSLFNADLTEDMIAGAAGGLAQATAFVTGGSPWILLMAAFKHQ